MTKVFIAGTFDILHPGHINLIKQARGLGDFLVVVLARDQNVIKVKGRSPYFNERQRLENLINLMQKSKFKNFNKVILGDLNDPYMIINEEKPDIIALGYDQERFVEGLKSKTQDSRFKTKIIRLPPFKENVCKGKNIRQAIEDSQSGFLLIDKPMDWTSHDVVAKLRSITKIKQIGHTGTLDPFATGLLICAIGQATKLVGMFDLLSKTYEAIVRLGVVSDTYDRTGKITKLKEPGTKQIQNQKSEIQTILQSFIGKQQQVPPMFSAKKVHGKKLYELARKGQIIERRPSEVEIYEIEELGTLRLRSGRVRNKPARHSPARPASRSEAGEAKPMAGGELRIRVKCSTGTYIRTLAHNIGQKLGCGAILWELKRTAIGDFTVNQAVQLNQLNQNNYPDYFIKPLAALESINTFYFKNG